MRNPIKKDIDLQDSENQNKEKEYRSHGKYYLVCPITDPGGYRIYRSKSEMADSMGVRYQSIRLLRIADNLFRYRIYDVWVLEFEAEGRIIEGNVYAYFEAGENRKVTLHRNIKCLSEYRQCSAPGLQRMMKNKMSHKFNDGGYVIRIELDKPNYRWKENA